MKIINNTWLALGLSLLILSCHSCNDMLEETPRSVLTPDFFATSQGLEAGLNAAYAGLRSYFYGGGITGTDEFSLTDAVNATEACTNTYDNLLNSVNGAGGTWSAFIYINTCNGILEKGLEVEDMNESRRKTLFAETKFLRALYYLRLVQTYGAVPLDLGTGKLAFNSTATTLSVRNPVSEVYEVIINDLQEALADLPDKGAQKGRADKASALHFLAKAYLTRAGDKEAGQAGDYADAFRYADQLIQNRAAYGRELQQNYALVHLEGHEDDAETIFNVQCTHDYEFGEGNTMNYVFTAGYENVTVEGVRIVPRCMEYQRPWRMYTPTPWLIFNAFDNKANDSRWDGSFRMMWECRASAENGSSAADIEKLAAYGMQYGDTAILLILTDEIPPQHQNKKYVIYTPNQFYMNSAAQYMYPNLTKYDDTKRFALNEVSMRPVFIARLAETYLVAAEALVMQGKKQEALTYINAVRRRAAHREGLTAEQQAAAEQAMTLTDPNVLDIDFILDERTREMCGEGWRWFDLTRTNKLVERVRLYNEKGAPNIQDFHVLRPIPQTQLDLMSDETQRDAYQNEGYY
ncbi:MAG: RagB/SusD family nutrient uptake outer membrane protein [Tannerellaceae bacterium]|jgi:hypothetical protein|nr:RagB/SusD family nutrient uptake outer membrane protein [Tannerellaceae bacterium]